MKLLNITFNRETCVFYCKSNYLSILENCSIVVCDLDLQCPYYTWNNVNIHTDLDVWIAPFANERIKNIVLHDKRFPGLLIKVYGPNKRLLQTEKFCFNNVKQKINRSFLSPTHDDVGWSYVDFFFGELCNGMNVNGTIVDAGANVGFFSLFCKENGYNKIYAIEPDPLPFNFLEYNFKNDQSVYCINKVLSVNNEKIKFDISLKSSVASAFNKEYDTEIISAELDAISLPTILQIEEKINLLKLDVEGYEFDIIETLPNECFDKIDQLFIEFHKNSTPIYKKLYDIGYSIEYRNSNKMSQVGFIYAKK